MAACALRTRPPVHFSAEPRPVRLTAQRRGFLRAGDIELNSRRFVLLQSVRESRELPSVCAVGLIFHGASQRLKEADSDEAKPVWTFGLRMPRRESHLLLFNSFPVRTCTSLFVDHSQRREALNRNSIARTFVLKIMIALNQAIIRDLNDFRKILPINGPSGSLRI